MSPGVPQAVLTRTEELMTAHRPLDITYEPVDSHQQSDLLRSGRLDFGVLRPPIDDTDLIGRIVSDEPLGIVVHRRSPLAERPILTWPDLVALRPRSFIADDTELVWRAIEPNPPRERLALAVRAATVWARLLIPAPIPGPMQQPADQAGIM
jgi:DNA-binding transcriptional LysR family regulator